MLAHQEYQPRISVPTLASAAKPFGGYKPETDQLVRTLQQTGISDLERLRKLRDELKQMPPEVVLEMMEFHRGLDMFQALDLAKRTGKLLVPNIVHDMVLTRTSSVYEVWTGTLLIYEEPNKPFGESIVDYKIKFTVPEHFRGLVNCALAIEHPDFDLVKLGNGEYEITVRDMSTIHLVENLPTKVAWCSCENQFGLPSGEGNKRRLWRSNHSSIDLLPRDANCDNNLWRRYIPVLAPSCQTGVALIG